MEQALYVDAAKSGRAKCTSCHANIPLNGLRIGKQYSMDHSGLRYQHLRCFNFSNFAKDGKLPEDVLFGWEKLTPPQQACARQAWSGKQTKCVRTPKPPSTGAKREKSCKSAKVWSKPGKTTGTSCCGPASQQAFLYTPQQHSAASSGAAATELADQWCAQGRLSVAHSVWLAANLNHPAVAGAFELYRFAGDEADLLDTIVHAYNVQQSL